MKKFFVYIFSIFTLFLCVGCNKTDDLQKIGKNLSHYEINIDLDCENKSANCLEEFYFVNNTDSILRNLKFHLYPQFFKEGATQNVVGNTKLNNAYPNGMDYAEFEVTRIVVGGNDENVSYEGEFNDILNVLLPSSIVPNDSIKVLIEFNFSLPNCEHRFGYGENTINLGNFYPILCVYENGEFNTNGYNSNGDPFYSNMANYDVTIKCDKNYVVASTGEKNEELIEGNTKTTNIHALMVRDFALVLSDKFETISKKLNNTLIEYYYFDDNYSEQSLNASVNAINTFSNLFGDYPYSTFCVVKTDFLYGGMEYPNLVMISADISDLDDYLNVIIHETAHQWWYGMVGNDEFTYPWLDEALTEFSTLLFYDNNSGYNFTHAQMLSACQSNYTLFITVYEDVLGKIDTSMRSVNEYDTEPEYTYCIYVKGVLMYESLYQLIGKNAFINGCKDYFSTYKYKNATPTNLIESFEKSSKKDLKNFFASWLNGKVVIR